MSEQVVASARSAAGAAAKRADVEVATASSMGDLRQVSYLLESVWGRNDEGAPIGSEVMRSLVHAGGCVTVARDRSGELAGAAVLTPATPAGSAYSLIAAAAPGRPDRGIGVALKLDQRAWALSRGQMEIRWTFDPLVGRNARFNLVKLGAHAAEYEIGFYGRMSDDLNGDDESDRLVVTWILDSSRAIDAAEGTVPEPTEAAEGAAAGTVGPDGAPMIRRTDSALWVRVPADVVALRRSDPAQALRWRLAVRDAFLGAFADGLVATHATRQGWYLLTPRGGS